ncbi:hypothetical protein HDU86_000447 [Geranomyces michiganensis]|nr:hypothetical protein HDU86_000447 [Geranomyces michiganensis]
MMATYVKPKKKKKSFDPAWLYAPKVLVQGDLQCNRCKENLPRSHYSQTQRSRDYKRACYRCVADYEGSWADFKTTQQWLTTGGALPRDNLADTAGRRPVSGGWEVPSEGNDERPGVNVPGSAAYNARANGVPPPLQQSSRKTQPAQNRPTPANRHQPASKSISAGGWDGPLEADDEKPEMSAPVIVTSKAQANGMSPPLAQPVRKQQTSVTASRGQLASETNSGAAAKSGSPSPALNVNVTANKENSGSRPGTAGKNEPATDKPTLSLSQFQTGPTNGVKRDGKAEGLHNSKNETSIVKSALTPATRARYLISIGQIMATPKRTALAQSATKLRLGLILYTGYRGFAMVEGLVADIEKFVTQLQDIKKLCGVRVKDVISEDRKDERRKIADDEGAPACVEVRTLDEFVQRLKAVSLLGLWEKHLGINASV